MKKLPNFLIIGAAKSGTTSLQSYLGQHPEVYFSPYKEPNYFALSGRKIPHAGPADPETLYQLIYFHSVTDFDAYVSLFDAANSQRAVGEASVRYLYYEEAAPRILSTLPDVRLVAILREPVSRLYSHYCMNVQYQLEPLTLIEAIKAENSRRAANWGWDWHYVGVSSYAAQLERYYALFDRKQIKVFLYDDFLKKPMEVFQEVCRHIGVDHRFVPDMSKRGKVASRPKYLALDRWLHWPNPTRSRLSRLLPRRVFSTITSRLASWNSLPVPPLDKGVKHELSGLFRDDVKRLEKLLDRSIPWYQ